MSDDLDNSAPFDDDQGTRTADKPTGAGAEATESTDGKPKGRSQDHESGYGGRAGDAKQPSDIPQSRR